MSDISVHQRISLRRAIERRFGSSASGYSYSRRNSDFTVTDDESGSWVRGTFSESGRLTVRSTHDAAFPVEPAPPAAPKPSIRIVSENNGATLRAMYGERCLASALLRRPYAKGALFTLSRSNGADAGTADTVPEARRMLRQVAAAYLAEMDAPAAPVASDPVSAGDIEDDGLDAAVEAAATLSRSALVQAARETDALNVSDPVAAESYERAARAAGWRPAREIPEQYDSDATVWVRPNVPARGEYPAGGFYEALSAKDACEDAGIDPAPSDQVPADVPCYLAIAYKDGTETVLGVFRVAEHASAAEAEREAGKLCDRIRAAAPGSNCGSRYSGGTDPEVITGNGEFRAGRGAIVTGWFPTRDEAIAEFWSLSAMVQQPSQQQQGQAAPSGFYAFQARGERAPRAPEPRIMGPQERDGITPKTIQAQTVQVRTRAEWYAFHHACRHLARQRMAAGRPGETMIPANICGRMHRLDVSRLSISHRIEGDKARRVTNGSHIAVKASMISARPRRQLIAVELESAAQYRRNAASEARHGNKHRRGLSIRAARASISEARSLAACCLRLPD